MAILGCIADDFTGAGDMASFLDLGGMRTILYTGVPTKTQREDGADAIVIALKTRTQETGAAVKDSLDALQYLIGRGCSHFYVKYCSTFDSTPTGNIGPVCDAVMEALGVRYTLLCPALPVNGRTVREGKLYVNGIPLQESPMKQHPLTPMWDCELKKLMEPQSRYPVYPIGRRFNETEYPEEHYYLVPDSECDDDLNAIVRHFGNARLLTGGSGLAVGLAGYLLGRRQSGAAKRFGGAQGNALLLAGSCSEATRGQIAHFQRRGGISFHLTPEMLLGGNWNCAVFWTQVRHALDNGDVLVYSSDTAEGVKAAQQRWGDVSAALEQTMAALAEQARAENVDKLVIAGGETSGAVIRQLGMRSFHIGESVAPGVPVMIPEEAPEVRLVLKSGNFGQLDFFERAIQILSE